MKRYIVNKGEHGPLHKQSSFNAASHAKKEGFIEFYDDKGDLVKAINENLVKTIDIEN